MELYCHAREKTENIFLYFFTELKTYHLSYSIYKHEAIDFADPRSMQDACHINFVMDLALRRVCGSVVELGALRFVSSWGIFSFSHAREKTENIFLYFFTELKTNHLSYSILKHRNFQSSKVPFLLGNFFFFPRSGKDRKHLSLFLYRAQD